MIEIPCLRFLVILRVESSLMFFDHWLKGYHIRSLLEEVMKRQFPCQITDQCNKCSKASSCEYVLFFHPQIIDNKASSKMIILPNLNKRNVFIYGEKLSFEIRLFCDLAHERFFTVRLLPALEHGGKFTGLGKWRGTKSDQFGRFNLDRVYIWQKSAWQLYLDEDSQPQCHIIPEMAGTQAYDQSSSPLVIEFITPVLFRREKKAIQNPSFFDLVKAAERRVQSLSGISSRLSDDNIICQMETISSHFYSVIHNAKKRADVYSIGEMVVSHLPEELIAILSCGSFAHIGKGVSMGMGGFVIRQLHGESTQ